MSHGCDMVSARFTLQIILPCFGPDQSYHLLSGSLLSTAHIHPPKLHTAPWRYLTLVCAYLLASIRAILLVTSRHSREHFRMKKLFAIS